MDKPLLTNDLLSILKKCKKDKIPEAARSLYEQISENALDSDRVIGNHLVPTLVVCGCISEAQKVFDKLSYRNIISWTYLIQGYVECGEFTNGLAFYWDMQKACVTPNRFTFLPILKACCRLNCLIQSRKIHSEIVNHGLEDDIFLGNSLIDVYAKCGSLSEAQNVIDRLPIRDVISWTALIAGFAENGLPKDALRCFDLMKTEDVDPNSVTYLYSLKACASLRCLRKGREIHMEIVKDGYERDLLSGSTLMDLYAKCGLTTEAHEVFNELPTQNTVLWTTLISGYTDQGLEEKALDCLDEMQTRSMCPDEVTFICSLKACGSLGVVEKGLELHMLIIKEEYERNHLVGSALLDMYAKCGLISEAKEVFDELSSRDVVSWTSLMAAYAYQGQNELVFCSFEQMCEEGVKPNETTFLIMLNVCSHVGLANMGLCYYHIMISKHHLSPTMKHHNCLVDLLARAGQLNEASGMLYQIPAQPNVVTWETILGSCRKWGDISLAKHVFENAVDLDETHDGVHVLMSNIYVDVVNQE